MIKNKAKLYVLLTVIVVAALGGLIFVQHKSDMSIPQAITKQVNYVLFVPDSEWIINQKTIAYDTANKTVQYTATQSGKDIVVSQQATPSQFTDIPQFFPTFLDKLNQYESFGTVNGTVYLTKPTEQKGGVQAILNQNGTLLFAHPKGAMSTDQWREFFNGMQQLKP